MKKRLLSLFSGCGGMDLGFHGDFYVHERSINNPDWIQKRMDHKILLKRTKFDIVFANDILESAKNTWCNYFKSHDISSDIFKVDSIVNLVIQHKKTKSMLPDNIDILTGGFPCQDYSIAGKRLAFNSHKSHEGALLTSYENPNIENRGELYMWMREMIGIVKPKIFIGENVKGMKSIPDIVDTIKRDFESIKDEEYLVLKPEVLHAGNFGIPQTRERLFFIGLKVSSLKKDALKFFRGLSDAENLNPYPPITHYLPNSTKNHSLFQRPDLAKFVSPKVVLGDLSEPWESNDISHKARSKAKYYGKKVQGQIEVDIHGLSPTIRAEHHGNIEFRRLNKKNGGKIIEERGLHQRRLTVRECARLQTFPDDYEFVSNKTNFNISMSEAYKLIGNAVPPVLAYNIAMRIQELWPKLFLED